MKGVLWGAAEFFVWFGMLVMLLIFSLLLTQCSSKEVQSTRSAIADSNSLAERQEALAILDYPVEHNNQNMSLAELIASAYSEELFDGIAVEVQRALLAQGKGVGKMPVLVVKRNNWEWSPGKNFPLIGSINLPDSFGGVTIEVHKADPLYYKVPVVSECQRLGFRYLDEDGKVWVYWESIPSGGSLAWSEDGVCCVSSRIVENDKLGRSCDGTLAKDCFVQHRSFIEGLRPNAEKCAEVCG